MEKANMLVSGMIERNIIHGETFKNLDKLCEGVAQAMLTYSAMYRGNGLSKAAVMMRLSSKAILYSGINLGRGVDWVSKSKSKNAENAWNTGNMARGLPALVSKAIEAIFTAVTFRVLWQGAENLPFNRVVKYGALFGLFATQCYKPEELKIQVNQVNQKSQKNVCKNTVNIREGIQKLCKYYLVAQAFTWCYDSNLGSIGSKAWNLQVRAVGSTLLNTARHAYNQVGRWELGTAAVLALGKAVDSRSKRSNLEGEQFDQQ